MISLQEAVTTFKDAEVFENTPNKIPQSIHNIAEKLFGSSTRLTRSLAVKEVYRRLAQEYFKA